MKAYYHANCNDGFCCAWLWRKAYPDCVLLPYTHQQTTPDVSRGEKVFFLDISLSRGQIEQLEALGVDYMVIDHHPATRLVQGPHVIYDADKSGARLVWEYLWDQGERLFHYTTRGKPHFLVEYTEDRDLWKHTLPCTREVNAAISSYEQSHDQWDSFDLKTLMQTGIHVLRVKNANIDRIIEQNGMLVKFHGYTVPCVNSPVYMSDIGDALKTEGEFVIIWNQNDEGKYRYSLRSASYDVEALAKQYGGGGHKLAAGFTADKAVHEN